jgi:hypothetical protein
MKTLIYYNIFTFANQCCQKKYYDEQLRVEIYRNIEDNVLSTIAIKNYVFCDLRKDSGKNEK